MRLVRSSHATRRRTRDPRSRRKPPPPPPNASIGPVGKPQLVVAQMKHVALVDALVVDAHALVVDAVRRPEVLDIERAVATDHRGVLARDVAVLDRQVRRL